MCSCSPAGGSVASVVASNAPMNAPRVPAADLCMPYGPLGSGFATHTIYHYTTPKFEVSKSRIFEARIYEMARAREI